MLIFIYKITGELMEAAASKVKTKYIFTQLNLKTDTCLKEEISGIMM